MMTLSSLSDTRQQYWKWVIFEFLEEGISGYNRRQRWMFVRHEHLQVHWPVGQAHELPQLQVHPGPMGECQYWWFSLEIVDEHTHFEVVIS